MIYQGIVKNGVIILDNGASLPEGAVVHVSVPAKHDDGTSAAADGDPLFSMADLAVETGVADLATNIDHYLYGHPKK